MIQEEQPSMVSQNMNYLSQLKNLSLDKIVQRDKLFSNQKLVNNLNRLVANKDVRERTAEVDANYVSIICKGDITGVTKLMTIQEYEAALRYQSNMMSNLQNKLQQNNQNREFKIPIHSIQQIVLQAQKLFKLKVINIEDYRTLENFEKYNIYLDSSLAINKTSNADKKVAANINELMKNQNMDEFIQVQKFENHKNYDKSENKRIRISNMIKVIFKEQVQEENILFGKDGKIYIDENMKISITPISPIDKPYELYKIYEQKFIKEWQKQSKISSVVSLIQEGQTYAKLKNYLSYQGNKNYDSIMYCYLYILKLLYLIDEIYFWNQTFKKNINSLEIKEKKKIIKVADAIQYPKVWLERIFGTELDEDQYEKLFD